MFRLGRRRQIYRHTASYEGVLGTSLDIAIEATHPAAGPEAESRILAEIDRLEQIFSVYKADSEFNSWQQTFEEPIQVSKELATVLRAAENARLESAGAFLPIVEALTRAWRNAGGVPQSVQLIDPMSQMWLVDLGESTATRLTRHPASLNAIAKGYIVDCATESAFALDGVGEAMVNIGGDLRHMGLKPIEVAITDPSHHADNAVPLSKIKILNQGVATSGVYRRGFMVDGVHRSHVFDPKNLVPVIDVKSSTVVTATAMQADIVATILSVLAPEDGLAFANARSIPVLIVDTADRSLKSEEWKRLPDVLR